MLTNIQVPNVNLFSDEAQLHGAHILAIKQANQCAMHGHCYVNDGGTHIRLFPGNLKKWAAACVSFIVPFLDGGD